MKWEATLTNASFGQGWYLGTVEDKKWKTSMARISPVYGASRHQSRELQGADLEGFPNRREANDNMEVQLDSVQKPIEGVFRGGRKSRTLPLHDRSKLGHNLALVQNRTVKANLNDHLFIFAEDLRGQPRGKDIVDIFKETFLLDVLVGEEEGGLVSIYPTVSEKNLTRKILQLSTQQRPSILPSSLR